MNFARGSQDKRFSGVTPRHPRGGRDGGRDIQATYERDKLAFGAVGFVNQANDSSDNKKQINVKFRDDLKSAFEAKDLRPNVFVFFTNVNLTLGEKDELIQAAKDCGMEYCDIFDRERIRIALDSPDGFAARFQYLNLPMSKSEQVTFFAKWGDDIQSIISSQFDRMQKHFERILFMQEAASHLDYLSISFKLDRSYPAVEIGHFRAFCVVILKEVRYDVFQILFGVTDKGDRDFNRFFRTFTPGVAGGIVGGQWEFRLEDNANRVPMGSMLKCTQVGNFSEVGMDEVKSIKISYDKDDLVRLEPHLNLRDIDGATIIPIINKSLAEKISSIGIYGNIYKLRELVRGQFEIDSGSFNATVPLEFTEEELKDPWVRLRTDFGSNFRLDFSEETPKRVFAPREG